MRGNTMRGCLVVVIMLTAVLSPLIASARTWHVPSQAPTIQAGIDAASYGDTVLVACGTYYEHEITLEWGTGITLRSETGEPDCVTIDAEGISTAIVCWAEDENTLIEGFTVTGGYDPAARFLGAGMQCRDSFLTVRNCVFTENIANVGAGLYCWSGRPTITNCTFSDNTAIDDGAGICCLNSSPLITNCTFGGNSSNHWGGALYCSGGAEPSSPLIVNCTFFRNSAVDAGGGVFCLQASPTIVNSTLFENWATYGGGVFSAMMSSVLMERTIIASSGSGSALRCGSDGAAYLSCCDLWGNSGGDWMDCIADQYGVDGNISEDPLFCNPDDGDFTISDISPCAPGQQPDCGLIGALGVGCGPTAAVPTTWGLVKSVFQLRGER